MTIVSHVNLTICVSLYLNNRNIGRRICISTLRIQLWSLRCLKTCKLQPHQLQQVAGAIIVFICGSSSYSS
ncbi:unnamed protein product [Sphagnum balticum]